MQTYTTPGGAVVSPHVNVIQQLEARATDAPDHPALAFREGDGFSTVTTQELWDTVIELAAGLVAAGINPGDRIALHSSTRIEFTYFDYAIWAAGAATTTIYETSSPEQVEWIISDSGSVMLITENEGTRAVFDEVAEGLEDCSDVLIIGDGAIAALRAMATDEGRLEVARRIAAIEHSDLATLVYTSGTTGNPKGCVLSHYNFAWLIANLNGSVPELVTPENRTFMFLPLAHIFARAVQSSAVSTGVTMYYSSGMDNLLEEFPMAKPTWIFSVPRVFEKIYNGAKAKADADGKGKIFDKAVDVAIAYSKDVERGRTKIATKLAHATFDKLVYAKIRERFGGDVAYAISGGAPLGARLGHFFRGIGLTALEGYGLTETTAGATVNTPRAIRVGSVGRPLPGVSIGIADDGEVLIKGGMVFDGYWKNAGATSDVLSDDGWFRSGDIGELDDEGYLSITGRKKEIIVTSAGKNVAPAVLEDRMRRNPLVSQTIVIGDAKPFIAALVAIDQEALTPWAAAHRKEGVPWEELRRSDDLIAAVGSAVDEANKAVSHAEAIKEFRILPEDLSVGGGELTPTLKMRRAVVAAKYADLIDDIYEPR
ncbi:MAG: long-chain fatty acid--CoA ligase [Actinomycetota bacterium]